jgi:hypothetical protein
MSTVLTINVQNQSPYQEQFFIFQQPAVYSGGPGSYSNSLYSRGLNGADSGDQLTFQTNTQYSAAVQETRTATPQIGTASGYESVTQLIDLGASNNTPANNDCAQMTWDASSQALGLCAPVNNPQVPAGAFRIVTATYNPTTTPFNVGSATVVNNNIVLSNFVIGAPNTNVDCQPILKFYVQTGSFAQGTVMNFTYSSTTAAVCDFTGGKTSILVVYIADGTWTVSYGS